MAAGKIEIGLDGIKRKKELDEQISQNFSELFESPTGKEVQRYLRSITIEMVSVPNITDAELRHIEGQRYLVGVMERRVQHGHRSKQK